MWKKKLVWKNTSLQFEVITPEDIVEEVNAQRDTFSFKASYKDPDSAHVVNEIELTIKRNFVNLPPNLLQPEDIKPEPREYYEKEATMSKASGSGTKLEKSSDDTMSGQKKRNDDANGDVVSAGFLEGRVIQTRDKFTELQRRKQISDPQQRGYDDLENDDGRDLPEWSDKMLIEVANEQDATPPPTLADRSALSRGEERGKAIASSSKKIRLKVIDECFREMVFSVSPSTKLRKLMMDYSRRLEVDVSCFKFIFDGRRIMEDETVKQLEMEDGDTINVVSNVSPMVTCTESQIQQKDKVTTQVRDHVNEHQVHKRTRIRDRPSFPDSNDNVETKSSSQKEEMRVEHTLKFRIGDPVWAKVRGFAQHWPGKICIPPQALKRPPIKQQMHCVKFFGDWGLFDWIEESSIKDFEQFKDTFTKNKIKNKQMSQALQEMEFYLYVESSRGTKGHPEAKKREANDSDSSASGPSSTKMARVSKTQTKPAAKELEAGGQGLSQPGAKPHPGVE